MTLNTADSIRSAVFRFVLTMLAAATAAGTSLVTAAAPDDAAADRAIEAEFEGELATASADAARSVEIYVAEGRVTLTGTAPNLRAKESAAALAESISGVQAVENRLEVLAAERPDERIRDDVVFALLDDEAADAYEIEVAVAAGEVTLSGIADHWKEKQRAAAVASSVPGVTAVINNLAVRPPETRSDEEIADAVEAALADDVWIDDLRLQVEVEDGDVALAGRVASLAEKKRAHAAAWVDGVVSVNASQITIEPRRGEADTPLPAAVSSRSAGSAVTHRASDGVADAGRQ